MRRVLLFMAHLAAMTAFILHSRRKIGKRDKKNLFPSLLLNNSDQMDLNPSLGLVILPDSMFLWWLSAQVE